MRSERISPIVRLEIDDVHHAGRGPSVSGRCDADRESKTVSIESDALDASSDAEPGEIERGNQIVIEDAVDPNGRIHPSRRITSTGNAGGQHPR